MDMSKSCNCQNKIEKSAEHFQSELVDKISIHERLHGCGVLWFKNFKNFWSV